MMTKHFINVASVQAQEKAATDAEAAQAALQLAQEKADSNEARAVAAEEKLASETAARNETDSKLRELQVCSLLHALTRSSKQGSITVLYSGF